MLDTRDARAANLQKMMEDCLADADGEIARRIAAHPLRFAGAAGMCRDS